MFEKESVDMEEDQLQGNDVVEGEEVVASSRISLTFYKMLYVLHNILYFKYIFANI